jgi:GT2 family glycosyltransferase
MKIDIIKVKELEKMRRKISNNDNEVSLGSVVGNFYELELLNDSQLKKELDFKVLYIMRIFWKLMYDLDKEKEGYDVKEWESKDYFNFFNENIDKIDLNDKSYKMYFKDMVKLMYNDIISK